MIWKTKTYKELTKEELYEILRLRMQVFVVEQGGRYQDLDGIDMGSIHIFCENPEGEVIGCLRVFPKEGDEGTIQIGRVVTSVREKGIGMELMRRAQLVAMEQFQVRKLYLVGRKSALKFYEKCGYKIQKEIVQEGLTICYELIKEV